MNKNEEKCNHYIPAFERVSVWCLTGDAENFFPLTLANSSQRTKAPESERREIIDECQTKNPNLRSHSGENVNKILQKINKNT